MLDTDILQRHYPLVKWANEKILRTVCLPVWSVSSKIKKLWKNMLKLMHIYDGVGLAAPQINQNLRMAAVTQWDMRKEDWKLLDEFVIINPRVLASSQVMEIDKEWCLSLPGEQWRVARSQSITIEYTGLDGKKMIHKATWFNARVILHEIDHLDGVLFIDKLV